MSMPDGGQSTCSYNPTSNDEVVDPDQNCTNQAAWHVLIRDSGPDLDGMYSSCDAHASRVMLIDGKRQFHEFGPGCGTEDSYWHTHHNSCSTAEAAMAAGIFWYECTEALPDPKGLALGCYARYRGQWYRLAGKFLGVGNPMWLGSKPPHGYNPDAATFTIEREG